MAKPNLTEVYEALRRADAEGNAADVAALTEYINKVSAQPDEAPEPAGEVTVSSPASTAAWSGVGGVAGAASKPFLDKGFEALEKANLQAPAPVAKIPEARYPGQLEGTRKWRQSAEQISEEAKPVKRATRLTEKYPNIDLTKGTKVTQGAAPGMLEKAKIFAKGMGEHKVLPYLGKTLGGAGAGFEAADLYNAIQARDIPKSILSGAGLASGVIGTVAPHPLIKAGATGVGLTAEALKAYLDRTRAQDIVHGAPEQPENTDATGSSFRTGGLVHLKKGGEPEFGEARAYEPSYSEKIRDYAAKYMSPQRADVLFGGPRADVVDEFNPFGVALRTPGAIADAATGFVKSGKEGDYLGGMGNYLTGAMNVAPMLKPAGKAAGVAARELGPKAADVLENYLAKIGGINYAVPKAKMSPSISLGNVLPETSSAQTVTDPLRNAFPGIYKRPDVIAQEAAARVAPESPALKQLFGVSRDDLYQMGKGRVGNMPGILPGAAANPKGSKAALNVMNPQNEQRLIDVLTESEKHPELVRGMDPWYIMDPAFNRLKELVGPEEAIKRYKQLNTLTGMASPGSDVLTEMNRGTAANYLATQGRFKDFVDYAGKPMGARGAGFPEDLRAVMGHPYHRTAQAIPMQQYLDTGAVQMSSPKVPAYIQASSVPEVGFQTDLPVGDAHWSRAVGLADTRGTATRKGKEVIPGASVSNPEMSTLAPWWKDKIAGQVGLESVPAQARAWGAFSPQTGVESPIGAPKLELLSMKIMEAAKRLNISPEQARDLILTGKAYAGKKEGGAV